MIFGAVGAAAAGAGAVYDKFKAQKADLADELRKSAPDNKFIDLAVEIAQLPQGAWDSVASQVALGTVIRVNTPRTIANI